MEEVTTRVTNKQTEISISKSKRLKVTFVVSVLLDTKISKFKLNTESSLAFSSVAASTQRSTL